MKYRSLRILSVIASLSLIGIFITQSFWLKKSIALAERQFDHRANQMLSDVLSELKTYADTIGYMVDGKIVNDTLKLLDVIDTNLLENVVRKYSTYHKLDSVFSYALFETDSKKIIFSSDNFKLKNKESEYKACLSCIWKKQYTHLTVIYPNKEKNILSKEVIWIILSGLFLFSTIGVFIFILFNLYRQKKIAEIKNDFINNMTHELKTPISTISVASEVLMKAKDIAGDSRTQKYSQIIYDENKRMRKLVERVLDIAALDRGLIAVEKEEIDIHDTIFKTVENFCLETCAKDVEIKYNFNAINSTIYADRLHIRNIINNLVDNAIKYSPDSPSIDISTENNNNGIVISVKDKGKGIPKDSLKKVFDKFYRVPSGNIHDVKGFGLGLYYCKTMIEAHSGIIEINSTLNKGTTITVTLPQ